MRLTRPWLRSPWLPPSAAIRCRTARRCPTAPTGVEGRLRYRSYNDKKGMRRYVTEIYADNMELLTPRSAHDAAAQAAPGADKAAGDKQADDKDNLPF